jgi:hypothetical protein
METCGFVLWGALLVYIRSPWLDKTKLQLQELLNTPLGCEMIAFRPIKERFSTTNGGKLIQTMADLKYILTFKLTKATK